MGNIEQTIKDALTDKTIKKKLPSPKGDQPQNDIPLDDYSESSKKELENLLRDIQKQ